MGAIPMLKKKQTKVLGPSMQVFLFYMEHNNLAKLIFYPKERQEKIEELQSWFQECMRPQVDNLV